jgi:hypothetical protein
MKAYKQTEVYLHSFLTSALYGGKLLTPRPDRFIPGTEPLYPLNMKLGGSRSRSGRIGEKENLLPFSNPGPSSPEPSRCTDHTTQE